MLYYTHKHNAARAKCRHEVNNAWLNTPDASFT